MLVNCNHNRVSHLSSQWSLCFSLTRQWEINKISLDCNHPQNVLYWGSKYGFNDLFAFEIDYLAFSFTGYQQHPRH